MLIFSDNTFMGIFTTFLKAKQYIDTKFALEFKRENGIVCDIQKCNYYNWIIIPCVEVSTYLDQVAKVDKLYVVNNIICTSLESEGDIDNYLVKMTYDEIKMYEDIMLSDIVEEIDHLDKYEDESYIEVIDR